MFNSLAMALRAKIDQLLKDGNPSLARRESIHLDRVMNKEGKEAESETDKTEILDDLIR
jgi:hypothetical protein